MSTRKLLEQAEQELGALAPTGADCRCKISNERGAHFLLPENMVDDCPLHGKVSRETMTRVAADRGPARSTASGRIVHPLDPRVDDVHLDDIANVLSLTCRHSGHSRTFFSFAQHAVMVSELVERRICQTTRTLASSREAIVEQAELEIATCMQALLVDAPIAYIGDVVAPLKSLPMMTAYRVAELTWQLTIAAAFALPEALSPLVLECDRIIFAAEVRDLLPAPPEGVDLPDCRGVTTLSPWGPTVAHGKFMFRFDELTRELARCKGVPNG